MPYMLILMMSWARWAMVGAVALYLVQAVPYAGFRWVEDENWYGSVAYALHKEGHIRNPIFEDSQPESKADPRPPAMPLTLAAAFKVLGVGTVQARTPGLLAGAGLVMVTYGVGSLILSPWAGALGAVLVATDNFVILTARTARPEIYTAFFSALGVFFFLLSRRRSPWLWALLSGVAIGTAMSYHVNGVAALAVGLLPLAEHRWRFYRSPQLWALFMGVSLLVVPTALWLRATPERIASFKVIYGRGSHTTGEMLLLQEGSRYADLIGLPNKRFRLPVPIPLRLHIVLAVLAAFAFLAWKRRNLAIVLGVLLIPGPLFWTIELNPTVRFFAIPAYLMALILSCAVCLAWEKTSWRRGAALAVGIVMLSQIAGNLILLNNARKADYGHLSARLRQAIPPGSTVYGAITFWMGLHDYRYYCYNKTRLSTATGPLRAGYIISNDRVLVSGSGYWEDSFADLRSEINGFLKERGELVARVPDDFYGDLEVYRVRYDTPLVP